MGAGATGGAGVVAVVSLLVPAALEIQFQQPEVFRSSHRYNLIILSNQGAG